MNRFFGKLAVVTGSSSGIGVAITKALLKNGVSVVGMARREDKLQALKLELIEAGYKEKFYPVKCDISKEDEVFSAFKWVNENAGNVSVLVNNAGFFSPTSFQNVSKDTVNSIIDTNVKGLIFCSKYTLKSMKKNSIEGHIVNLCSITGQDETPPLAAVGIYSSSKHAIRILSDTMRREMMEEKTGIKISNLSPGLVESEMTSSFLPKDTSQYLLAEDVADACINILNTPPNVTVKKNFLYCPLKISELVIRPTNEHLMWN